MLSLFCKLPVRPLRTAADVRDGFMARVLLSVLQFRLSGRYAEAAPPFINIDLDHSDSGREGCAVSTLTITSEPRDWQGAVQARAPACRPARRPGLRRGGGTECGRPPRAPGSKALSEQPAVTVAPGLCER